MSRFGQRHLIEAGLIVILVIVAVGVSGPEHVQGPNMSEICGPSEWLVVESNYIGCTRGGRVPPVGDGAGFLTWGSDGRGGFEVYWSRRGVTLWEKLKCLVGVELCTRWVGELSPEEVSAAREYFGLDGEPIACVSSERFVVQADYVGVAPDGPTGDDGAGVVTEIGNLDGSVVLWTSDAGELEAGVTALFTGELSTNEQAEVRGIIDSYVGDQTWECG